MMHFLYFFLVKKEEQASSSGTTQSFFLQLFMGPLPYYDIVVFSAGGHLFIVA